MRYVHICVDDDFFLFFSSRIVEGGKYKTSFLLPDDEEGGSEGLLISETVVPGFEYTDHDFMTRERLQALVTQDEAKLLDWMLKKG